MSVSQNKKAEKFCALHAGPRAFIIPNPWDAGSARILEGLGFEALATTSAGFAFSLGRRDGEVTREEALAHCRAITDASDLPVAADLENCFGDDPKTVAETIRLAGSTGIVGGSVEDATSDGKICEHAHAVERVTAAVEAARALPFPFTLTARAENFLHGRADLDDTIRRLQAFAAAGADVLYAPGLANLEAIREVCAAVAPKPVNVLAGMKGANFPLTELEAAGARRLSVGGALARAALGALLRAGREMKEKGTFTFVDEASPSAEVGAFMETRRRKASERGND
ncbi:MAG TPA: isocitrate lyase/phosphoenolpyruvate mutase family protein [Candidatus Limnocylindria bacterium]|nr:isocitrate lyase/phosphoenolpyruvate mutase family protein [Candidatus Limnocylindria bacterium]